MQGKIAFEEHFAVEETLEETKAFAGDSGQFDVFQRQILDLETERLERMDANGIALAILSLNAPGVQRITDSGLALEIAQKANAAMTAAVEKHPSRYRAFAALPMHNAKIAADELKRTVEQHGFKGCMLNGFQQMGDGREVKYYDQPEYHDFWATVAELDVPVYLHPRMQIPSRAQNYEGHPWLMSAPWGFAVETSIHALRLCGSGIFEQFPELKICLGHLGENIPFGLGRLDDRMRFSPRGYRGKRPLGDYFKENFHITTSGNFHNEPFRCTLDVLDPDKVYFSSDYPFEAMEYGCGWFDSTDEISAEQKLAIGRNNAIRLFKLEL